MCRFWMMSLFSVLLFGGAAQVKAQNKADADREPPGAAALSADCKVPRAYQAEIQRLLDKAAEHCTHSSACVDGPGTRFVVSDLRVCPLKHRDGLFEMKASYVLAKFAEGDTRMCNRREGLKSLPSPGPKGAPAVAVDPNAGLPDLCSGRPWTKRFQARFTFRKKGKGKKAGMALPVPRTLPGFPRFGPPDKDAPSSSLAPGCTPLDKPHEQGCYGKSDAFVPKRLRAK